MASERVTYKQLDELLARLGFTRNRIEPKWLRYEHAASDTEIILADKAPNETVRPTDAWSARAHLIQKGLITAAEIDMLWHSPPVRASLVPD